MKFRKGMFIVGSLRRGSGLVISRSNVVWIDNKKN